jgi:glycosyltransferase involved in cell wall biosynthesis
MAERLLKFGVDPQRVVVIPNWAYDKEISPINHRDNPLRRQWGLDHKFVVGYSGNLGRVHEFETVLEAAGRLQNTPDIVFLFIGGGHRLSELTQLIQARGLNDKFRFIPYQERKQLKYSLSVPDAHWLSLRPELEGFVVPSKFFGIAAAGRPVIAISAKDGEIPRLVRQHGCGEVIVPGNVDGLVETILCWSKDKNRVAELGSAARVMLDAHFTQAQALERWQHALDKIE